MATMVQPSLLLKMDLDKNFYSEDVVAELKRSYSYISPITVECHEGEEFGIENIIRFAVKIQHPYWHSSEEGADELWESVMMKWFSNMFEKISSTILAYNRICAEKGEPVLSFSWIDIELCEGLCVSVLLNSDSSIPKGTPVLLEKLRDMFNTNAFGEKKIARIRIPARYAVIEARLAADNEALENQPGEKVGSAVPAALSCSVWDITFANGITQQFSTESNSLLP